MSAAPANPAAAHPTPAEKKAAITPADLPPYWRELWEERAAIVEYDGGQQRNQAETDALAEILHRISRAESQARLDDRTHRG